MTEHSDKPAGAALPRVHVRAAREAGVARPSGPRHGFRYRVDLEYLGTRYSGWQFQTNARTVAGEIMEAIHRATGQRVIEVYGSGRTDAGVHAIHQVAHIDLAKPVDPDELLRAVNDELPGDINLLKVELAPDGFHARHSATGPQLHLPDIEAAQRLRQTRGVVGPGSTECARDGRGREIALRAS